MGESGLGRRAFLGGLLKVAGGVALAGCVTEPEAVPVVPEGGAPAVPEGGAPEVPALPDGLLERDFIVHGRSPLALEARRGAMGAGVITPLSRFFVRNNLPHPDPSVVAHPEQWRLEVDGVARPASLSLRELQGLGLESVAAVIQCSGNGRAFFTHGPSGSPWATGAAGCALWVGVRVADVLAHLGGAVPDARFLTGTGGEALPEGVDALSVVVERSVPLEKGLRDCLLAWEMNGEPIPISHGGPLRLIVPGYYGVNQVKYIRRLAATVAETSAKIQVSGYRMREIGVKGGSDQASMWRMPVKSWFHGPGAGGEAVLPGRLRLSGVALSGERGVKGVEVSVDGGQSWEAARLVGPDLGPNAWRSFSFEAEFEVGEHVVCCRATDAEGEVQAELRVENERGYGHTGWRDHGLRLSVVAALPAAAEVVGAERRVRGEPSAAAERGKLVFERDAQPSCGACHTLADAGAQGQVGPNLDVLAPTEARVEAAVRGGVGAMPAFPGLSEGQVKDLAAYVAERSLGK